MADFTIIRKRSHRVRDGFIYEGECTWPTTATSATLPVPSAGKVRRAILTPAHGTLTAPTLTIAHNVSCAASIAATSVFTWRMPRTGTITAITIDGTTTIAANDTNYYDYGILNKTATSTVVDRTTAANSNKSTGGSALTAYTAMSLTLGAGTAVTAGDLYELTITKASSPSSLTGFSVNVTYTYTGINDEQWYAPAANATSGYFALSSGKLTFTRSGSSPTSGAKAQFLIECGI